MGNSATLVGSNDRRSARRNGYTGGDRSIQTQGMGREYGHDECHGGRVALSEIETCYLKGVAIYPVIRPHGCKKKW